MRPNLEQLILASRVGLTVWKLIPLTRRSFPAAGGFDHCLASLIEWEVNTVNLRLSRVMQMLGS